MVLQNTQLIQWAVDILELIGLTFMVIILNKFKEEFVFLFGKRNTKLLMIGLGLIVLSSIADILNEIVKTTLTNVLDDILLIIAIGIIFYGLYSVGKRAQIEVFPSTMSSNMTKNEITTISEGTYLYPTTDIERVLKLLRGKKILAITRDPKKFEEANIPYIWVTKADTKNSIHPRNLAQLLQHIIDILDENTGVLLDCVEYLILENDFTSVFKFLTTLKDHALQKKGIVIIVLEKGALEDKEYKLLEREFFLLE